MFRFLLASVLGWTAVVGIGVETALPYMLRNAVAAVDGGSRFYRTGVRIKMRRHYWLGYALVAVVLAHTACTMGPAMARSEEVGIWAATLAGLMLLVQVSLGLILKGYSSRPHWVRPAHFGSMLVLAALVCVHLWRNG